jgi:hypothetical protein
MAMRILPVGNSASSISARPTVRRITQDTVL